MLAHHALTRRRPQSITMTVGLPSIRRCCGRRPSTSVAPAPNTSRNFGALLWHKIRQRPLEYASIPCVAAFVGISGNWMGVKMLFYPIDYVGIDWRRWPDTPYGLLGWQGVVPTKTEQMAGRLVVIVTERLLSLPEAFGRLDPGILGPLLLPAVQEHVRNECGVHWARVLQPVLPLLLRHLLTQLQDEIDSCLDLHHIVLSAFVRDKAVLVDLFQKVGRVELEFLVNSGFLFGFVLGLFQMAAWVKAPARWTLPVAGSFVGYVTNWVAIKLLFEPAEPVNIGNIFILQGLFESRQVEVSDEFADFMQNRVLNSSALLENLAMGGDDGDLFVFLRRHLPAPIPSHILVAAVNAIDHVAKHPMDYPELHAYVTEHLDIERTLSSRLKKLSPKDFEDLLHPVFQEDEMTLILTGGVLGLIAGGAQTKLGWGGPRASAIAAMTIAFTLASSLGFYLHQKYEEVTDEPLVSKERPHLRRSETIIRPGALVADSLFGGDNYS